MSDKTFIVIPAFNEEATIRGLVGRCLKQNLPVIVVDDGSCDNTLGKLNGLPITVLRNEKNSGKAATLWHGMQHALSLGAKQIISLDGDGQHQPEDIPAVLETAATQQGKIIIAARLKDNEKAPRARLFANRFADFWISWAAGHWVHDSQSGFRLYPGDFLTHYQPVINRKNGFVFESRIIIDAARTGVQTAATPISSSYHANARASHFRPVVDISRIVRMVAWSLFSRGMYLPGLLQALKSR